MFPPPSTCAASALRLSAFVPLLVGVFCVVLSDGGTIELGVVAGECCCRAGGAIVGNGARGDTMDGCAGLGGAFTLFAMFCCPLHAGGDTVCVLSFEFAFIMSLLLIPGGWYSIGATYSVLVSLKL
jgi:hypothetical protein